MKKVIFVLVLVSIFAATGWCEMPVSQEKPVGTTETAQPVQAGNAICPVEGGPVSGSDFVEYQGKLYGLCCPMCKASFLADPESYIAKLKDLEAKEPVAAAVSTTAM